MVLHQLLYGLSSVDLLGKAQCLLYMSTVTFNVNVRRVGDLEFTYFGISEEIGVWLGKEEGEKFSYELVSAFRGKTASRQRVRRAQTQPTTTVLPCKAGISRGNPWNSSHGIPGIFPHQIPTTFLVC